MHLRLFFIVLGVIATTSFAQVRDLFAEFEAETVVSSSSVVAESSSSSILATSSSSSSVVAESSSSSILATSSSSSSVVAESSSSSILATSSSSYSLEQPPSPVIIMSPSPAIDSSVVVESSSSVVAESSSSLHVVAPIASSSSISRRDVLGPVKVSKIRGINEMKGSYKSPRKALFMSLVLPGTGQIYIGSSTFNYVRGGAYIAVEAALWSGWYYYSVHKYNKQASKYKGFANNNFSVGSYEQSMRHIYLLQLEDASEESNFKLRYLNNREAYCKSIYGTATTNNCYSNDNLFRNDSRHLAAFDEVPLGETLKGMNLYDNNQFYQIIANPTYVLGWVDVQDRASYQELGLSDSNLETVPLGTSSHLDTYQDMRKKANDYASMQAWFFGGLILNHVISAFDAALSANTHNKLLYEDKLSWLEAMRLGSSVSLFDGFAASVQAYWNF